MIWQQVTVGEFLKNREERFKPSDIRIRNLRRIDKIDFSGQLYLSNKPSNTDMILVKKNDLVISGINVEKGAMCIYDEDEDISATIHYSSYEIDKKKIDVDFLKLFLISPEFKDAIKEQVPGGIKTEIKPKHLLPLRILIPKTLIEQTKIVNKFDSLKAQVLESSSEIKNQIHFIKKLRQQILQDAIQGKLIPQNPNDEPASVLLEKIKVEKDKLISEKKLKKTKPISSIKTEEIPFDIPKNWIWCKLEQLRTPNREITYGIVKLGDNVNEGVFTLRTSDVKPGNIITSSIRKVKHSISEKYKRTILQGEEILYAIRGTLGGVAIVPSEMKGYNISRELAMIPIPNIISSKYILNVLLSPLIQKRTLSKLRGIAYKGLNLGHLREFLVPLPPYKEQIRIVNKIDELFKICDDMEMKVKQNQNLTQQLLQSALKEALEPKN